MFYKNLKGIYLFAMQKDKCQEKVWQKGVEFEEGKKDLSSKGLFPLLKNLPLSGTERQFGGNPSSPLTTYLIPSKIR